MSRMTLTSKRPMTLFQKPSELEQGRKKFIEDIKHLLDEYGKKKEFSINDYSANYRALVDLTSQISTCFNDFENHLKQSLKYPNISRKLIENVYNELKEETQGKPGAEICEKLIQNRLNPQSGVKVPLSQVQEGYQGYRPRS